MYKLCLTVLSMLAALAVNAQTTSRLTVSLGSGSSTIALSNVKESGGLTVSADAGYVFYKRISNDVQIGFRTGLGVAFSNCRIASDYVNAFSYMDNGGSIVDYLITSPELTYNQRQYSIEIPAMFAFENNGFFVNAGLKFQIPFVTRYDQSITDPLIIAYLWDTEEYKINDKATGLVSEEQQYMSGKGYNVICSFALAAEVGHQWALKGNRTLGFNVFVDYSPLSVRSSKDISGPLIEVAHPTGYIGPEATVSVRQMTESENFSFNRLNAGLKIVYSFELNCKSGK